MTKVYTHPGQPEMQVEVILASESDKNVLATSRSPNIYTVRCRYPRFIHSEMMTHRKFSRNARSSRAVPLKKMIQEVRDNPVIPWHWGKNKPGMQAGDNHNQAVILDDVLYVKDFGLDWEGKEQTPQQAWAIAANQAADIAEAFMEAEYHKQIPNRLLEPFMWMDTLITATDWDNFFWLRDHEDAEPHIRDLAVLIKQAIEEAEVQTLSLGEWHMPYITEEDIEASKTTHKNVDSFLFALSAARCARISYKPFDGNDSYERELERYKMLVNSDRIHASPIEHQAKPDYYVGGNYMTPNLHGNFTGWIQQRKLVEKYTQFK